MAGILLFIIIVIVVIVIIKKKKSSKETLIHTDFDPSIADKINGDDIKEESINQPQSLEYTLPEEKTSNHIEVQEKGPQFLVQKIEEEPEVIDLPTGPQIKVPNAEPVSSSTNSEN